MKRADLLDYACAAARKFAVIVIGGGATGAGIAWDAALRGLSVLLIERGDFGQGTSSRSTKLIHGGVRYLAQGQIALVREALHERTRLLTNARDYVKPLSFVIPTTNAFEQLKYRVGLAGYDWLARASRLPPAHPVSKADFASLRPLLQPGLNRAMYFTDAQFDDTRLLLAVLGRAVAHGACVLNYTAALGLLRRADGRINGVTLRDVETGTTYDIQSDMVINAAGPQVSAVAGLEHTAAGPGTTLSRGSHVVVARDFWPRDEALLIPRTPDGRVMFAIPWHGHVLLGTTDVPTADASTPRASAAEIDFILEVAARYLCHAPTRADLLACFAGVRPLMASDGQAATSRVSREYQITISPAGLVSIVGGKWTTFRRMAEDCLDQALAHHGRHAEPCRTATDPIKTAFSLHPPILGGGLPGADASTDSTALVANLPYTRAHARAAIRFEMARRVEDILARRTRALFLNARAAVAAAPAVAQLLAEELGHSPNWVTRELAAFANIAENYLPEPTPTRS